MISVVIPVYKKTEDFVANLKHNLPYLKGYEIIVVNDDPTTSIRAQLETFPITLIENVQNLGFAGAVNRGIEACTQPYVFLLNSDVLLSNRDVEQCIRQFEQNDRLFAVALAQKESDGSIVGKNELYWFHGLLNHRKARDLKRGENGWAEGGSSIFRRDILKQLGGFDSIYKPFYWEDIELSYRAKKHGFHTIFDPSVVVIHHHESTIGTYWSRRAINVIATRNQILTSWKYLSDTNLLIHMGYLMAHVLRSIITGNFVFLEGLIKASLFLFRPSFYTIR